MVSLAPAGPHFADQEWRELETVNSRPGSGANFEIAAAENTKNSRTMALVCWARPTKLTRNPRAAASRPDHGTRHVSAVATIAALSLWVALVMLIIQVTF
jgi:hypothetical protein